MMIKNNTSYQNNTLNILQKCSKNINANPFSNKTDTTKSPNLIKQSSINQTMRKKIDMLNSKLRLSQISEKETQNAMSFLQEKEMCLEKIRSAGERLKELSDQYTNPTLNGTDKVNVQTEAEEILEGLKNLMNDKILGDPKLLDSKSISIADSNGENSIILSKSFDITLKFKNLYPDKPSDMDTNTLFEDKHFKNKLSLTTILNNTSIIEDNILQPVKTAIEEVNSKETDIYNKFLDAFSEANSSIDDLVKFGILDRSKEMRMQESIYKNIFDLYHQSSNINKDNVYKLLK